ncbi:MAG TPA: glycosyltransferase family 2 protein [Solirubrobacterales bacterium]|nr:glycosyltransferase family 2 protein [Solirubrobacterales bacterium]
MSRPRRTLGGRLGTGLALGLQGALALATAYLLALLLAARDAVRRPQPEAPAAAERLRLVVLVPAHDEEDGIAATIESLAACEYPDASRRTVVVADNCSDRTAEVARAAGAEVWERRDPDLRGKGFAVAWALERLLAPPAEVDAVVFVDADCTVSANLLEAVDRHLAAGAEALQVDYLASNPEDSATSALRFAAFALADTVRFHGKERLGLSCGLVGTGMAFTAAALRDAPWTTTGLVEDGEYHMRLVLAGVRTEFVPEAWVTQAVPTTMAASSEQQARWEQGRLDLARAWAPRLIGAGLARRDPVRLHAGLESLVPPQSVIAVGGLAGLAVGVLGRQRRLRALALLTLGGQACFVLGGLRLVRAPASVYRALLSAPLLIANKLALYAQLLRGRGPSGWVRTERERQP